MSGTGPLEAVRRAREQLGEAASPEEIAAFVERAFGLAVRPAIVRVLLASLREIEVVERSRARALELAEQARAEAAAGEAARKPRRSKRSKQADEAERPTSEAANSG